MNPRRRIIDPDRGIPGVEVDVELHIGRKAAGLSPCTCLPACSDKVCKGECGCQGCHEDYGDFLSLR